MMPASRILLSGWRDCNPSPARSRSMPAGSDIKPRLKMCYAALGALPLLIASAVLTDPAARADALQDYAQQCDAAIGATVPDFDCDAGTEVPVTHPVAGPNNTVAQCDRPNRLNGVCDPGSRFQVLTRTANVF